ncbi:MAG: hypothetical protein AAGF23_03255 [Acidobacteriota bacterium]
MTAEVAVMNTSGIALAADSAVTLGQTQKVYASVDKLFQPSANLPVGIMIYGNASLLGLPWETIIKLYGSALEGQSLPKLSDYADRLAEFLDQNCDSMFPREPQKAMVSEACQILLLSLRERAQKRMGEAFQNEPPGADASWIESTVSDALGRAVQRELERVRRFPFLDAHDQASATEFRIQHSAEISAGIEAQFRGWPGYETHRGEIESLLVESLIRATDETPYSSGFVVAGFGEREYFPSLVELQFRGLMANRSLSTRIQEVVISVGTQESAVIPFAQTDVVETFMKGASPATRYMISNHVREILIESMRKGEPSTGSSSDVADLINGYESLWDACEAHYVNPTLDIVASLPRAELGAMAEALVNITKLKRRISYDPGTVGGPVDVALISKADGFAWFRRKNSLEIYG